MRLALWSFEIGYTLQHLATILQILRIHSKKNTEQVSLDSNIIFLITTIAKVFWVTDTMLKRYWITYVEMVLAFASLGALIYYYLQYRKNDFLVQDVPKYLKWYSILPVICVISFFSHPGSKGPYYFTLQMLVSVTIYGEALGLLPQIYILRTTKDTGNVSQYYCIGLGLSRILRFFFWIQMYMYNSTFVWLMIADFLHTVLFGFFVFTYVKNINTFSLPTFGNPQVQTKKVF